MEEFDKLAPYIQDYIYDKRWIDFTDIQKKAIPQVLNSNNNIILASSTASGKTEAAFFPILTDLYNNPSKSISVLYISPLIALINDQFERLYQLLEIEDFPLVRWHGQSLQAPKRNVIKDPKGIIQITPESLEALLIKEGHNIKRLFFDLRYIVIDELHSFMSNERGLQIISLISRIEHLIKKEVRIIGLSATISSYDMAAQFINNCNSKKTNICIGKDKESLLFLSVSEFNYYNSKDESDGVVAIEQPLLKQIYSLVNNKKSIIFTNSRKDVEAITAGLKDLVKKQNSMLEVYSHHGSLSKMKRDETEEALKTKNNICVGATITLELGIDIGELDLIVQVGSSFSVSSFVQRLGRSGRKGQQRNMFFLLKKYDSLFRKDPLYFPLDLIKNIAIIELYIKEKWIEPNSEFKYCYFILVHQLISTIKSLGALAPSSLARRILSIKVFKYISHKELKELLLHLIDLDILEIMEDNSINLGQKGENLSTYYDFYAVFKTEKEMLVKFQNKIIGTVGKEVNIGDRIVLSSVKWKVVDKDLEKMEILVINDGLGGKAKWEGDYYINTDIKIVQKMKEILANNGEYKYLNKNAKQYLEKCREKFKYLKLDSSLIIKQDSATYNLYCWLGTKESRALSILLTHFGFRNSCQNDFVITIEKPFISYNEIVEVLNKISFCKLPSIEELKISKSIVYGNFKYDKFLPYEYAKKQYIDYYCDFNSLKNHLSNIMRQEYHFNSIY
ncbi:MAG: DEAD/DEAH box helicase [Pleomorphochaeta sp.]